MKKSQLRQIIREEIQLLNEGISSKELRQYLTKLAKSFGEVHFYVGDDDKIYD